MDDGRSMRAGKDSLAARDWRDGRDKRDGSGAEVRGFQNVEPRTSNFASRISRMSHVSCATVGAAEVGDDESRVGDGVCREGGCVLTGYRGAQSLGRLADGKRKRRVLLNLPEMGHRIPAPSWNREPRQPRFGGASHGASGTDSRLPVVAVLPRSLGCREFLFNQHCRCHHARFFQYLKSCTVSPGHCEQLTIRSASCRLDIRERQRALGGQGVQYTKRSE